MNLLRAAKSLVAVPRTVAAGRAATAAAVRRVVAVAPRSSATAAAFSFFALPRRRVVGVAARGFSSSSSSTPATGSGDAFSSSSGEVKLMAWYVGADSLASIAIPAGHAARAYRFTQPHSVLIPLDGLVDGPAARPLSEVFALPPVPVAPIVRIPSASSTPASGSSVLPSSASLAFDSQRPFMVAFQYGAVVFFNCSEAQQMAILPRGAASDNAKLKDDYKILLRGGANDSFTQCRFVTDSVEVHGLDLNSVRIFSQILSQAVAMQHYEGEAHRLLRKLRAMMQPAELRKGVPTFGHQPSDLIVRYVAQSSTVMVDVLSELKLLDRSEIVWTSGHYEPLWSGLRREFDLSDRWEALQTKLDLLRDSHPFFLQVIHAGQTHRMEIIIILLIFIEVVLSVVFHSPLVPWVKEQLGFVDEDAEAEEPGHGKKLIKH